MKKIRVTTSAKINIGLRVFGVRSDGFHNIESIFFPVNESNSNLIGDKIEISEGCFCGAGKVRILTSGITIDGDPLKNSCVKAYNLLDKAFNLPPINIHLEKNVPIGAGLGGGSADGVYTLRALCELFELPLINEQLFEFAAALGSDCPFFLNPQPSLIEGRGEIITPLGTGKCAERFSNSTLSNLYENYRIEIVPSNIFISTPQAYSVVAERAEDDAAPSLLELVAQPVEQWQNSIVNDFEEPVFKEYPQLRATKERLIAQGAVYAAMTGSGSAIYGIMKKEV